MALNLSVESNMGSPKCALPEMLPEETDSFSENAVVPSDPVGEVTSAEPIQLPDNVGIVTPPPPPPPVPPPPDANVETGIKPMVRATSNVARVVNREFVF